MTETSPYYRVENGHVLIPEAELATLLARRDSAGPKNLRDEFAMAALTGLTAALEEDERKDVLNGIVGGKRVSTAAYMYADAMMKAREQAND